MSDLRTIWRSCAAASLALLGGLADATAAPVRRPTDRPTPAELKVKVAEVQLLIARHASCADIESACLAIKALGQPERIGSVLAQLYAEAEKEERITILHVLKRTGARHVVAALPLIAQDFAAARPDHPNDMSFAAFYVLEDIMHQSYKQLPADNPKGKDVKQPQRAKDEPEIKVKPHDRVSEDGLVSVGTAKDRSAIRRAIEDRKLHRIGKQVYNLPSEDSTDWLRIIGDHAFVRLRGDHHGVDYLFMRSDKGKWSLLTTMGEWVN